MLSFTIKLSSKKLSITLIHKWHLAYSSYAYLCVRHYTSDIVNVSILTDISLLGAVILSGQIRTISHAFKNFSTLGSHLSAEYQLSISNLPVIY